MRARLAVVPGGAEAEHAGSAVVAAWQGSPDPRAYVRRLLLPAAAMSFVALVAGVGLVWLSFNGDHMFVYPLIGAASVALGAYGLLIRPLLVARAARGVRYRIDGRGLELVWSAERRVLIPPEEVPAFKVLPAISRACASASAATPPRGDVIFAGPPAWSSPWGAWRIVDDTWGLVALERPDEAVAALERLRAASPTPTAWAVGVVTTPRVSVFVPWLHHLFVRLAPWRAG